VKKLRKKIYYPQATPEALLFFTSPIEREEIAKISPSERFACPVTQLLKLPAKSAFKHLILKTPLCQHLLLNMSSSLTSVELRLKLTAKGDRSLSNLPFFMCSPSLVPP
jgi:hypothetical protein